MQHARVLVVDDRDHSRRQIGARLRERGYRTTLACDGAEGWEAFEAAPPDAVVTDVRMPRSDGLELLERIRSRSRVPVFCLTAYPDLDTGLLAMQAGAAWYFRWPRDLDRLLEALDEALQDGAAARTDTSVAELRREGRSRRVARRRDAVTDALRRTEGNVLRAAEQLGISRRTLYHWIDRYGIRLRD